jgi:hypothetical protein
MIKKFELIYLKKLEPLFFHIIFISPQSGEQYKKTTQAEKKIE